MTKLIPLECHHEIKLHSKLEIKDELVLEIKEKNSWDGINFVYELNQDDVYIAELEVIPSNDNILLEAILPTDKKEIRIKSFILASPQKIQFIFSPENKSNSISLRISSYGDFSPGSVKITKFQISDLFPIFDDDDLIKKIQLLGPWFHQINLNGIKTRNVSSTDSPSLKGENTSFFTKQDFVDNPIWIWSKFKDSLPELKGLNVLDVACNAGFYSFELAKKGAKVTGIDNSYEDFVRAKFAKKILNIENIEFKIINVENLLEELNQKFDLVLCLGLLYHLEEPGLIINKIAQLSNNIIFETIADLDSQELKLINDRTITSDGYIPTIPWLKNAFQEAGFSEITQITTKNFPRVVFKCRKD